MLTIKKIPIIIFLIFVGGFFISQLALACAICDSQLGQAVRSEIIHTQFLFFAVNIFIFFIIFFCIAFVTPYFILYGEDKKNTVSIQHPVRFLNKHPLPVAGMLSGGAIAGFLDAILFHQILQTHGMVSDYLPITAIVNVKVNMFWDGFFEFFTLITLLIGLRLLWKGKKNLINLSGRVFTGWLFLGFGLFNFLEGLIDHEFLELHHVLQQTAEPGRFYADILFLVVALTAILVGAMMVKKSDVI